VDRVFSRHGPTDAATAPAGEFPLRGEARLAELEEFYGIRLEAPETGTLEDFLRGRVGADLQVGHSVTVGPVTLTVRDMIDGRVETVGLSFSAGEGPPAGQ
jgi:NhaP-type Na+/H+ and K+/H+ antiporter